MAKRFDQQSDINKYDFLQVLKILRTEKLITLVRISNHIEIFLSLL